MRLAWWSAVASIALAVPCGAQGAADTLSILAEIRPAAWVAAQSPGVVQRTFLADLRVVLVREDAASALVPLRAHDLTVMRVTPTRAFALANANLRRRLTPFASELPVASSELSGMRSIEGSTLEASRLLLDDDWRELAAQLGGPVVAVAPLSRALIFGRDSMTQVSRNTSLPASHFLELVAGVLTPYGKREDVLSTVVLRWTDAGWQVVPAMTAAERQALQRQPADKGSAPSPDGAATATTAPAADAALPAPFVPTKSAAPGKPGTKARPRKP